ncbi:GTPase ObgE [Candidatus Weimeria sp. HCP3S3_B5]|uniref:GTPase ObgE n=1 Tax=Candidatus Weimeria sp. HCP3S3_B5 TaxID=3438871 RepID=UPI002A96E19B|nr:GTPase ObgE [Lachnospiraceae bacterium]
MFADRARIIIQSGKGGNGHVSFRREKYVPAGGPDGGDGGRGGDIIFEVSDRVNNLSDYRQRRKFAATDGQEGGKKKCHGKDGQDLVLYVPQGTVVKEAQTGQVICDMSGDNKRVIVLKGGKGGIGNMHFATSTMQAPKYAKPGGEAKSLEVILELKLLADVGLVGYPNAGKSTLLSRLSNAKPEIADYPFTTLNPILGVVDLPGGGSFVMADIPGIIEGASEGVGLGLEFLRHIERCKVLIHMVDISGVVREDPVKDITDINLEMASYSKELLDKPVIIALNKADTRPDDAEELRKKVEDTFHRKTFTISAVTGQGVKELVSEVVKELDEYKDTSVIYQSNFNPDEFFKEDDSFTVTVNKDGEYEVEGPKVLKMLGFTNLDSEKGFAFFQKFLKEQGILKRLEEMGITDGDTVRVYGHVFEYYK